MLLLPPYGWRERRWPQVRRCRALHRQAMPPCTGEELGNPLECYGSAQIGRQGGSHADYKFAMSFVAKQVSAGVPVGFAGKQHPGYAQQQLRTFNFELQTNTPHTHAPSGKVLACLNNLRQPPDGCLNVCSSVPAHRGERCRLVDVCRRRPASRNAIGGFPTP